jgi:hypothetical protein
MVEAAASIMQPLRVDARPADRLDQLELWTAAREGKPQCPLGRLAAMFTAQPLWSEKPSTPRSCAHHGEAADGVVQIGNDECELERCATGERGNDNRV